MMLRRSLATCAALFAIALLLSGCGNKTAQNGAATSDSLLASSPVEQPQGQIEPQQGMPAGDTTQAAPAPAATTPPAETSKPKSTPKPKPAPAPAPTATVPAGTGLKITMNERLNSETATAGQAWTGKLDEAITIGSAAPFPAGSTVHGVVEGVSGAAKGSRAYLVLRVTSIESNGTMHDISASADSMIAGSTTKRNLGAIAGGAAAGALLGKAVGGTGKSAVIGGILGGAAATGAVAASKGFQVDVPQGKSLIFKVDHDTKVKL